MDIDIALLQLNIDDAFGHEHRIGPIARRAAEILAARLGDRPRAGTGGGGASVPGASAGTVELDLNRMSDERAAVSIATAWIGALTAKLEAGG